jgi:hypothetical protein
LVLHCNVGENCAGIKLASDLTIFTVFFVPIIKGSFLNAVLFKKIPFAGTAFKAGFDQCKHFFLAFVLHRFLQWANFPTKLYWLWFQYNMDLAGRLPNLLSGYTLVHGFISVDIDRFYNHWIATLIDANLTYLIINQICVL